MGRRVPLLSLSFALALALAVSAVVLLAYDAHGARITLAIVAPVAIVTVLAGEALAARRPGSLRTQFGAITLLGALSLAAAVGLFVYLMFFSSHDAVMTVLLVSFAAALVVWLARRLGGLVLADLDHIRATLGAVADGRRDVRTAMTGHDEIASVGRDVDAMIVRLDREERMRRELFAAVSHDLRTPITALGLLATAIDDEVVEDAKRREYAARMNTHVRALAALIDDLFDLTRLEAKELEWTMERLRLEQLVEDAVEAMRPTADAGSVAVHAELCPPLAPSLGNHEQLQRVLFNLIQNAIHHTPPDGSVTVRAEDVDGGVEIEVADTGSGIDPLQRERVFEPFFRADSSRHTPGAGLGLAISRAIVEAHGGAIWLEEAPVGTRVRFQAARLSISADPVRVGGERNLERTLMPQYLLNIIQPDGDTPPDPEFLAPILRDLAQVNEECKAAGAWVFAAGLHAASAATVVRHEDGETLLTDGPYVEANEHIGGFTVIDGARPRRRAGVGAASYAEAITLPIEVRPRPSTETWTSNVSSARSTAAPWPSWSATSATSTPPRRRSRTRSPKPCGAGRRPACRRARRAGSSRPRATAGSTASAARRRARRNTRRPRWLRPASRGGGGRARWTTIACG